MSRWREFLDKNPYAPQLKTGIERRIDFGRWGFHLAYAGGRPMADVLLVYESAQCRVQFGYSRGRYATRKDKVGEAMEEHASYGYGRLHAPDEGDTVTIDGKVYVAWHDSPRLLNYLEYRNGRASLEEAAAAGGLPLRWGEISQDVAAHGPSTWLESWATRIAVSWERYGSELFDLLDLRRPDLWEGYRKFRKELWEAIKSRKFATMGDRAQASIDLLSPSYDHEIA